MHKVYWKLGDLKQTEKRGVWLGSQAQNKIELLMLPAALRFKSRPWVTKRPSDIASVGHRYLSAPVGHVLRVAEKTEPSKAAGAIVSSFSSHDKLLVMAKGAKAVYAAVKAIATARFISLRGRTEDGFDIAMQPILQRDPKSMTEVHQIRIYLYKVPVNQFSTMVGGQGETGVVGRKTMKVGASTDPRGLGGAIATTLLSNGVEECECLAAGFIPVYRAIRGVAVARHVMLKKHDPQMDQGKEEEEREEKEKLVEADDSMRQRGEVRVRGLWAFPHQKRLRPRVSAKDLGPGDREALDLMAFVGWRDFEGGKQCMALVLQACLPGHLEGEGQVEGNEEDELVAPRA